MTDHPENDEVNGAEVTNHSTTVNTVEANFEEEEKSLPEDIIARETQDKALYVDGMVLNESVENAIIAEVAAVARLFAVSRG